jgi:hypothetical protein
MKRDFHEIIDFIRRAKSDYRNSILPYKHEKKSCYKRIAKSIMLLLWGTISAPLFYPVWYVFRKRITDKIYAGTSWEEIKYLTMNNETELVKSKLKANGKLLYWIWSYGDIDDPLGRGGMPIEWGKNSFWHRFKWSAIRNPRFNVNYLELRTSLITEIQKSIDTRNFSLMHKSFGIGDSPDGIYFVWFKDKFDRWYMIYEDNNTVGIFYFGYVGLRRQGIGNTGCRFEVSYRPTDSSYFV